MTPPYLCPDSYTQDAPAGTMALQSHHTILRYLTQEQSFESVTGILHVFLSDTPTLTLRYWITTRSILPMFSHDHQGYGYDIIYFTPFSSEAAQTRLYPENPISNTISVRRTKTTPPNLPSLALSMSTSLTPATHQSHNSLSNPTVNPTAALIALI